MRCQALLTAVLFACFPSLLLAQAVPEKNPLQKRMAANNIEEAIKQMGILLQATRYPQLMEKAEQSFKKSYWALQPDVKLGAEQRKAEEKGVETMALAIATLMRERNVDMLYFLGIDDVGIPACMDWHYLANTSRGPVLLTVSVFFLENRTRVKSIRFTKDWDTIKQTVRSIDMKLPGTTTLTIKINPPGKDDKEKKVDVSTLAPVQ